MTIPRLATFTPILTGARFVNPQVEVGAETVVPTIVRAGEEVKPPPLNAARVQDLVTRLGPFARISVPRAVSQSIPPGTRVQKGTPIDVTLVPVSDINLGLLDQVHPDLINKSVADVLPVISDPVVQPLLQKQAADLTEGDKTTLKNKLQPLGVALDTTNATAVGQAFNTLVGAKAFQ